jgi:hypothetical protein
MEKLTYERVNETTVTIDGERFEKVNPKFKAGMWIIHSGKISRIVKFENNCYYLTFYDSVDGEYVGTIGYSLYELHGDRPATKEEIEKHLIAEAERRGFVFGAKFISPDDSNSIRVIKPYFDYGNISWYYKIETDVLRSKDGLVTNGERYSNPLIYEKGKWAEILPSKKPVPKTRAEFIAFFDAWHRSSHAAFVNGIERFLNDYDFND